MYTLDRLLCANFRLRPGSGSSEVRCVTQTWEPTTAQFAAHLEAIGQKEWPGLAPHGHT